MNPIAKILILSGLVLIVLGLFWQFGGKTLPLGRLPGDIAIEKENFKFFFPIATCILLSILGSFLLYIVQFFSKK
ncbi:MAG: DUF2905 domain-containing protein [Bdellovibrionia bacterium]